MLSMLRLHGPESETEAQTESNAESGIDTESESNAEYSSCVRPSRGVCER